jgi:DNA replication protein DnaT
MAKWIKVETHTPDKAEIRHIARLCHCTKAEAFLGFFRVYVWLDEQTENGQVNFFARQDADDLAGLNGFGAALEEVGWITFGQTGAVVSNWERHNGQSAKRRCLDAERKRGVRSESGQTSASEADDLRTR